MLVNRAQFADSHEPRDRIRERILAVRAIERTNGPRCNVNDFLRMWTFSFSLKGKFVPILFTWGGFRGIAYRIA